MSMTTPTIAEEEGAEALAELYAIAEMGCHDAIKRIGIVLGCPDEVDYARILIWGGQAHIVDLLESVVYLGFSGRTGSGKGTAVESCILLTPDGEVLGSTTEAYLASVLDEGKALGLEEVDKLLTKNPVIASLLRNGYRRGVSYGFMLPAAKGKGWERANRSIFGPKVFDFHSSLGTHLLGRTVVIEMKTDNSVDRAMDAEKKRIHLAPVRMWLESEARLAKENWTRERVATMWDDPVFRQRVKRMGGKWGRDHIVAATMLTVCDVFGWDLDDMVRRIVSSRKTIDEWGEEAEVIDAILEGATTEEDNEIPVEYLLLSVNDKRHSFKLNAMTPRRLSSILKDLGFEKGDTYYKSKSGTCRDKVVVRPYPLLEELHNASHVSHQSHQTQSNGTFGTDGTDK